MLQLFGWGKNKDIQPQTVLQQVKNPGALSSILQWRSSSLSDKLKRGDHNLESRECRLKFGVNLIFASHDVFGCTDPRNSRHGLDRETSFGPRMPFKGSSTVIRNKQRLFGVDDDGYLHGVTPKHKVNSSHNAPACDEKLQDTIRFVFSHEQEGLLAIGTFALEQLAAVRDAMEVHQKETAAGGHDQDGFDSCTGMMQSSDDEDALPRSWFANARKNSCELSVYELNDVYISGVESEAERRPHEEGPRDLKEFNHSKALALYKSKGNRTPIAGVKPIVLLTALPPELRKVFDPANLLYGKSQLPTFVPHWTDSVPIPVLARKDGPCADEESYYSSRFCGLFGSKKKSSTKRLSKRGTVHTEHEECQKLSTKVTDQDSKKSMFSFGSNGMPSLNKLAKMWRSSCKQSSARIAPKPCSPRPSQEFKVMKFEVSQALGSVACSQYISITLAVRFPPYLA